jgi:hypothetical protein
MIDIAAGSSVVEDQLPPSDYTPIPLETTDWDEMHEAMAAIERKLAFY